MCTACMFVTHAVSRGEISLGDISYLVHVGVPTGTVLFLCRGQRSFQVNRVTQCKPCSLIMISFKDKLPGKDFLEHKGIPN